LVHFLDGIPVKKAIELLSDGIEFSIADEEKLAQDKMLQDLVRLQTKGITILLLPNKASEVVPYLLRVRLSLSEGSHQWSPFLGTDQKPEGTPVARALQSVEGLGPKTAQRLEAELGPTLLDVLRAGPEAWADAGANKKMIIGLERLT